MPDATHHLDQLRNMLRFEEMVSERVGPPGCRARLTAADNAESLRWALAALSPPPPVANVLTLAAVQRIAGYGNFAQSKKD